MFVASPTLMRVTLESDKEREKIDLHGILHAYTPGLIVYLKLMRVFQASAVSTGIIVEGGYHAIKLMTICIFFSLNTSDIF